MTVPQNQVLKTYSADEVVVLYGGVPIEGWGDDNICSVEADENIWETSKGAKGEVTRSRNLGSSTATVTLTLKQTSSSLKYLNTQKQLDARTGNNALPLMIKEIRTGAYYQSPAAYFEQEPGAEFGTEAGEREIVLKAVRMEYIDAVR